MTNRMRCIAVLATIVGTIVSLAPPVFASVPQWVVESVAPPATRPTELPMAVSCATETLCVAVGAGGSVVADVGSYRHWQATQPVDPGVPNSRFTDVSCPATTLCIAVGTANGAALVEKWDGAAWSVLSSALANGLERVSCPTSTYCVAVGSEGGSYASEAWNGATWRRLPAFPRTADVFWNVSCSSPTFCMALVDAGYRSAAMVWDGEQWTDVSAGHFGAGDEFEDIDCRLSACTVVGFDKPKSRADFAVFRQGGGWTRPATPAGAGSVSLESVSCISPSSCTAVGYDRGPGSAPRAFSSAGQTWTTAAAPDVSYTNRNLECHLPRACYVGGADASFTSKVQWRNGSSWLDAHIPAGTAPVDAQLIDVSCVDAECAAVGVYYVGPLGRHSHPFAQVFDGSSWHPVVLPGHGDSQAALGVACPTANYCVATGYDGTGAQSWLWDGTTWAEHPIDAPSGMELNHVSCPSITMCLAVGGTVRAAGVFRWNGRSWSTVRPPLSGGLLTSVSCVTSTFCVAVQVVSRRTHVAVWRGSDWTLLDPSFYAESVSCVSTTSCYVAGEDGFETIVARFDGTQLSPVTILSIATESSLVSCASADSCALVGKDANSQHDTGLVWDGTRWRVDRPLVRDSTHLRGLSCASDSCVVVGYFNDNSLRQLVERLE